MRRRVVVTGIGWVTPLGADLGTVWNRLTEGRSGTRRLSLFDSSGYPVRIAAEVHDWSVAEIGENPRQWEQYPRQSGFALGAGVLAAAHAGLTDGSFHPLRAGVYLGCGEPFEDFHQFTNAICRSDADAVATPIRSDAADRSDGASAGTAAAASDRGSALRLFDPDAERQYDPNLPAIHLAGRLNLQGPNLNCIAACVSSAQAIGQSAAIIQRDEAD
ncbi:MAG: hypothetical protein KDA89_11415, partial [Planctomycetaceae bacterium]|nr:hypothetical protein [Planctomycetaceae bacterium]